VKAGIPAARAFQNATSLAASVLKQQGDLGSIEAGRLADLVLVDGNPAVNISDIRRCRVTIKNGAIFDDAKLYAAVGIEPAK
jgi:imidazolonepropionase-like amidohydrolase